jgi:hypothetical protein
MFNSKEDRDRAEKKLAPNPDEVTQTTQKIVKIPNDNLD